ncbi:MAG: hypothetical protein AAGA40_13480 [Cyanobacteria bacterium P01_E01_bin.45]
MRKNNGRFFPREKRSVQKINSFLKMALSNPQATVLLFLGRFNLFRRLLAQRTVDVSLTEEGSQKSIFPNIPKENILKELRRNGVAFGFKLSEDLTADIFKYASGTNCYAGGREHLGFNISEKKDIDEFYKKPFYIADYFNVSEECPPASVIANDPVILDIASRYIGSQAVFTGSSLTWIFPLKDIPFDSNRQENCHFHYDLDGFSCVRFFFLITTVSEGEGEHVFIRSSHKKKPILSLLNFLSRKQSDERILSYYGEDKHCSIVGHAGTGFVEDTFGFHKATVPTTVPRLLLQLHFADRNYNKGRYSDSRDPKQLKHFQTSISS